MTVGELMIKFGFEPDKKSEDSAVSHVNELKGMLTKALGAIGIGISINGIKNFVQQSTEVAAELKATDTQFNQTFKDLGENGQGVIADLSKQATVALEGVAEKTGISTGRMKASFASLGAFYKTGGQDAEHALDFAARASKIAADSAAYFDRSVEDTMDIMKRLMKGNFTLDDNLGFQSTQATRDADAMKMYSKAYKDLESWQQQEVILQQILNANRAMGAENQALNEADEWTNQVAEFQYQIKLLKGAIGKLSLPVILKVMTRAGEVLTKITDKTTKFVESFGDADTKGTKFNRFLTRLDEVLQKVAKGVEFVIDNVGTMIERMGGIQNVLTMVFSLFTAFKTYGFLFKISEKLKEHGGFLKTIYSIFGKFDLKLGAIALLVFVIINAVKQLWDYAHGKNNLLGNILGKAGISPEKVMSGFNAIFDWLKGLKEKFAPTGDALVKSGKRIFDMLIRLGTKVAPTMQPLIKMVGRFIDTVVTGLAEVLPPIIDGFTNLMVALEPVFEGLLKVGITLLELFVMTYEREWGKIKVILNAVAPILNALADLVKMFFALVTGDTDAASEYLQSALNHLDDAIVGIVTGIGDYVAGVFEDLADLASSWGFDMLANFLEGLVQGWDQLKSGVEGVAQGIKDRLGFSVPAKGPMHHADTWSPDMMALMASGIEKSKGRLFRAINGVAQTINSNFDVSGITATVAGTPNSFSERAVASGNVRNSSVVQNITFSNSFSGSDREAQRQASEQMRSNAEDTTEYLANALSYAGG